MRISVCIKPQLFARVHFDLPKADLRAEKSHDFHCHTTILQIHFPKSLNSKYLVIEPPHAHLLNSDGFRQVTREINIQTFSNGKPVGHELERDDVEETLKTIDRLWDLNLFRLASLEFVVVRVADDDGLA